MHHTLEFNISTNQTESNPEIPFDLSLRNRSSREIEGAADGDSVFLKNPNPFAHYPDYPSILCTDNPSLAHRRCSLVE